MRTALAFLLVLLFTAFASAQVFVTNKVSRAEAGKVTSRLKTGMWEEEVAKVLAKQGLTNAIGVGAIAEWGRFYTLADGTSLVLHYTPRKIATDGRWGGNGFLQKAFIQSNGVNIVSITLTNRP